ncbi:MAG: MltR family transcriptional regulator [Anaerolineales bacterium]
MLNRRSFDELTQEPHPKGFIDDIRGKSDRAVAVVGTVLLDMHLIQLLSAFFVDDPDEVDLLLGEDHPLGSFSARIRTAYCLGLISKAERDDLWSIQHIWGFFIRRMEDLAFSDDPIREWCYVLHLPEQALLSDERRTPRSLFVFATALLVQQLALRIRQAEVMRRHVPGGFSLIQVDGHDEE